MRKLPQVYPRRISERAFLPHLLAAVMASLAMTIVTVNAQPVQIPEPPLPVDPRPLTQLISPAEKAQLSESNPKKLIDVYLKIAETHLQSGLNAIKASNDRTAEQELDIYNKASAAAVKEAFALQDGKRSASKKIEQVLYKQIKTLETIERLFPDERAAFAVAALKHAKQLRVQALNEAFASGDVLKGPEDDKKPKSDHREKNDSPRDETIKPPQLRPAELQQPDLRLYSLTTTSSRRAAESSGSRVTMTVTYFNSATLVVQIPGDYLTEEEDDHVREAQAADARVKVFMRIADRRLKAITGPTGPSTEKDVKKIQEEEREWGALPKVSRVELLRHYARAISECIAKLEDAYERNPKSSTLPKALGYLRDATDKHLQILRALKSELTGETEAAALSGAISEAETANKGARDGVK